MGTFADPAAGSHQNFFEFNRLSETTATLEGAWLTDGLHLFTPGIAAPDLFNVRFELRDAQGGDVLDFTGSLSEAGYVRFFDANNATILRIDFDSALLAGSDLSAGFGSGTQADMSGAIADALWEDEHFSFGFTNFNPIDNDTFTMSSSFTSSAVPEPATLAVLGLGAAAVLRRRRRFFATDEGKHRA